MSKCLECGYYDKEKHYCPFYCQLIRETLDEAISFELENIKDRLEVAMWYNRRDKEYCLELIDKRISELKGD